MQPAPKSQALALAAVAAILAMAFIVAGCASPSTPAKDSTGARTSEASLTAMFPEATPTPAAAPMAPILTDPRSAVNSYLMWVTYAYRILDSNVASLTFDPYEEVRVNSYVMYNVQERRAIDQRLLDAKTKSLRSQGQTATVALHEEWAYRYISIDTVAYSSPINTVSYETTYTLVKDGLNWLVHSVEATSPAPVK